MLTVVVGAGYTGARILQRLSGTPALGLSRSVPKSGRGYSVSGFDLDLAQNRDGDPGLPVELPEDYTVIYTVPPASTGDVDEDPRLSRLLGLLSPPPKRIVYISTTGVYGNCDGALVNEDAEPRPGSVRATRRYAAEQLLQQLCRPHDIEFVILRVPGIYGPGRLGTESIRSGAPVLLETDAYPGNRIHVDDLVSCCIKATSRDVAPGIYNVGDGDVRSSTWFAHEVARQSDSPRRPEISRAQAEKEFSAQLMSFLSESRRIDTRRMIEVLGVTPRYANAEDGIKASLIEMGDRS